MGRAEYHTPAGWQRGDPVAFAELVRDWQQPLARFLFRVAGQPDRVADLCQEVFLRVYLARERYRENGQFAAWFYRIALNVARDAARRERWPLALLPAHDQPGTAAPVDEECLQQELQDLMAQAIAELPESQRIVLALHHDEGLNFEEIARRTHTPASTLKSRFAAALHHLRARLRQHGWSAQENHS